MSRRLGGCLETLGLEAWAERRSVQILVVVANIQMRTLKGEEGKGSILPTLETAQPGGRVQRLEEHRDASAWCRCAAALENPEDRVPTPGRTHNRIRSPRQGKSAKWIRNRGKGLARGLGTGSHPNPSAVGGLLELLPAGELVVAMPGGDGSGTPLWGAFRRRTADFRTVGGGHCPPFGSKARLGRSRSAEDIVRIHQVLDCSPTNRERELGLDRRETEWPCCHDPLRFSPMSHRFVPPPSCARTVGPKHIKENKTLSRRGSPLSARSRSSASPQATCGTREPA
ncbi:hypothetical protein H6P81_016058 [Aristolochia fimbriata]|uniref:Uncharacterized protein n=1 Tax=Aristolochia fimbriata TaxID=158543 RepID=A0AAV7E7P5_ARIFI|nr:hypothetical protein H6P81_016058 [Aristolochia fimbriata]